MPVKNSGNDDIKSYLPEKRLLNNQNPLDLLITELHLATMADATGYGMVRDGAIGIRDGRIAWVGALAEMPLSMVATAKERHEAGGIWATPGLIDCHTHLVYAGNRAEEYEQRLKGASYADIAKAGGGILSTVRATRTASEKELLAASARRLGAFLAEGVTTIEVKSGYGLDLASEAKMLRVARALGEHYSVRVATTFLGAHALPPEFASDADGYIDHLCNEMLPALARDGLVDAVDGFCENIGFSPAQITRLFEAAKALGLPVKLHAEQLSDQGGAALAARYGALSADHLEYLSEDGARAMAASGTVAVLLPGAFYVLKETKKPPMEWLRQHGVRMALASDCNPGTSPVTSLLLMLHMGCTLFGMTPEEALAGVTRHAAAALGLAHEIGTLAVGKAADIALWDIAHPAELAYHVGFNPCAGVVKNGELVMAKE